MKTDCRRNAVRRGGAERTITVLARALADAAPTPVEAGTTEVTVGVSVVYAIG